jgi:hypothetical protein
MSIVKNTNRIGNLTSSEIYKVLTKAKDKVNFGAPALTYIDEKNMERKLGRSLSTDMESRPTSWGKTLEGRVFELLGAEYRLCSQETITHKDYEFWCGSPDAEKFNLDGTKTVVDIKCPYTLKSFCELVEVSMFAIKNNHKAGNAYYWQLVSNAILIGADSAELIVYCPYQSELEAIKDYVSNMHESVQNSVAWINWATDDTLPYLLDNGYYRNLNVCSFSIPEEDKEELKEAVLRASKLLISRDIKRED